MWKECIMARVFISYSHDDEPYKRLLHDHLSTLVSTEFDVETVSDSDILPGSHWKDELQRFMDEADAGVLLLSTAFLKSEWCRAELSRLANRKPTALLLPVLARACEWRSISELRDLQLVNTEAPAQDSEEAWLEIARNIKKSVERKLRLVRSGGGSPRLDSENLVEVEWQDEWERIRRAVGQKLFTPVLGPGCYDAEADTLSTRDYLRNRLDWILGELEDDERARLYVEGIMASNHKEVMRHKASRTESPSEPWMRLLIEFQASLARLGAVCCRIMGEAMQTRPCGFTDIRTFATDVEPTSSRPGEKPLRSLFFETAGLAARLHEDSKLRQELLNRGLGTRGILEQLVMLTFTIFYADLKREDYDEEVKEWKEKYGTFVRAAGVLVQPVEIPRNPRLSLAHVEWIGDLLWHTIRFEAPMYPSPEDLAFQLAVCLDTSILPRKERVSTVAELASGKRRVELIRRWFHVYSRGGMSQFYEALARALCYAGPGEPLRKRRPGAAFEGSDEHVQTIPIAITTNFDMELEGALESHKRTYHVVFPVSVRESKGWEDDIRELPSDWLLRTVTWDEDDEPIPPTDVLLGKNTLEELAQQFLGPLIVKLHGSPLHKLPKPNKFVQGVPLRINLDKPSVEYEHRISLSDFDLIKAMVERDKYWPPGLKELLNAQGRVLCFLGYPLADTDSRIRLSEHLNSETQKRTLYLIDFPEDPLRHALLKRIKVGLIKSTIEVLTSRFLEWFPELSSPRGIER
jgi:TIR domain-containing protein/SIR2-like protein